MVWILTANPCPLPGQTATDLSHLTSASSRTLQNYLVWRLVLDRIGSLSQRFKEARVDYRKVSTSWRGSSCPGQALQHPFEPMKLRATHCHHLGSETGTW